MCCRLAEGSDCTMCCRLSASLRDVLAGERAEAVAEAIGGWSRGAVPLHVALATALDRGLRDGSIPEHLPSERALAAALHVSRGTVANAYELLRERGLVDRQQGSGSVARPHEAHAVCPDPIACVRGFFA
jgi:hypothetical protein